MGYFATVETILITSSISQEVKDAAVEQFLNYVFEKAWEIFESDGAPVFMCKDFGNPFYKIIETSLRVLSEEKCVGIMDEIVELFTKYMPDFQEKIKCVDNACDDDSAFCMNLIIFKLFWFILLFKKIMIKDLLTLQKMIEFLHLFSLCEMDTPPINSIWIIANESICILVNKSSLECDIILNFIWVQISNAMNLI